ncbi:MAG: TAXI family TRAP transporter solute-binding subunit [Chloroflexota bacterium]
MKKLAVLISIMVLLGLLAGMLSCGAPAKPEGTITLTEVAWAGSGPTASSYLSAIAVGQILEKYTDIGSTAVAGTIAERFGMFASGQVQFVHGYGDQGYKASRNLPEFDEATKGYKIPYTHAFAQYQYWNATWVRQDAGIKSFADLPGKKFIWDYPTSAWYANRFKVIAEMYGFNPDDVIKFESSGARKTDIFTVVEGRAAGSWGGMVHPGDADVMEAFETADMDMIGFESIERAQEFCDHPLVKSMGFVPGIMEAGGYKGFDHDVITVGTPNGWGVHKDLDTDLVYTITKTLYEHSDEVAEIYGPAGAGFQEQLISWDNAPYHPGVIKLAKEKGIWTKEKEAQQKKNLSEAWYYPDEWLWD